MDIKLLIIPLLTVLIIIVVLLLSLFISNTIKRIKSSRTELLLKKNNDIINMLTNAESYSDKEIMQHLNQAGNSSDIELILDRAAVISQSPVQHFQRFYDKSGITDNYIHLLKNSRSWEKRALAANRLGHIGSAKAVPLILSIVSNVNNEDEDVRSTALRALGRVRDKRAIPFLIKGLASPYTWLPPRLAEILFNIGNESAGYLQNELKNYHSESSRGWAAEILGWLEDDSAVMLLINALSDVSPDVRARASGALGKIRDSKAVNQLLELLIADPIPFVRVKASQALGAIGNPAAIDYCINILKDPEWWVRVRAVEALSQLGSKAVPALLIALKDKDVEVCKNASLALERIGYIDQILVDYEQKEYNPDINNILYLIARTGVIETIIERLGSANLHLQKRIVRLLGEAKATRAGDPLLLLLKKSRDWILTSRIITSLGRVGCKEAIPELIECLKADEYWIRKSAVEALGILKAGNRENEIAAILSDPHQHARESALTALLELEASGSRDKIEARLFDPSGKVRSTALKTLRKLNISADKGTILSLLTDNDVNVRVEAIKSISARSNSDGLAPVVRLLPYGPEAVRHAIVHYIRKVRPDTFQEITDILNMDTMPSDAVPYLLEISTLIRDDDALQFVLVMTESPDVFIREKAFSAISTFDFNEKVAVLEKGLFDKGASVRTAVLVSLTVNLDYVILKKAAGLSNDPVEDVRVALSLACGVSGNPEFMPLINGMLNDPSLKVIASSLISKAAFNDPALPEYLSSRENVIEIKHEVNAIAKDRRFSNIIKTIKSFSGKSNSLLVDYLLSDNEKTFSARLIHKLSEELDPAVRITAIDLLKITASGELFIAVLGISRKDPSAEVRLKAMDLLLSTGREEDIISALSSMLFDPALKVRVRAAELFGRFNSPESIQALLHALDTTDREFRESITTSLSHIFLKNPEAFSILVRRIPESNARKLGMAWLAGKTRKAGSIRFLLKMTGDANPDVRASAVGALAKFKNKRLIPSLEKLMYDPNERVRSAAINAISGIKDEKTFEIIMPALEDLVEFVKIRAAINLAKIDLTQAIEAIRPHAYKSPELSSCLKGAIFAAGISYDESIQCDSTAKEVLNELCPDNVMFHTFNQSPDKSKRLHSLRVLKLFHRDNCHDIITSALKDPCPDVRNEARKHITN